MRWLTRRRRAVAQDGGFWQEYPSLDARALRARLIRQCRTLHLQSPFSWRDYLGALLHVAVPAVAPGAFSRDDRAQPFAIRFIAFGPGESARWVMQRQTGEALRTARGAHPSPLFADGVRYALLLSSLANDEYLDRIVYHELGHLQRGHLAQALTMGGAELRCGSEDGSGAAVDTMNVTQRWEQEAEGYALTLTRLAHGWDPALAPSTVARFFDFLM